MESEFPHVAVFALPDAGDLVARLAVRSGVSVDDVVGDVEFTAGGPVTELRAVGVVADGVVVLVEVDAEVVDQFVPEPVDARGVDAVDFRRRPLDEGLVVVDIVGLHELPDVRRLDELAVRFVHHLVYIFEGLRCHILTLVDG